jgi:topoisomerase IA-like protein
MESESKVLGKINKKKCYLNHGKYGYYLTLDKNYKVPEWLPPDKMDIEIAERLIEYKIKMSEQWLESKPIKKKVEVIVKVKTNHPHQVKIKIKNNLI